MQNFTVRVTLMCDGTKWEGRRDCEKRSVKETNLKTSKWQYEYIDLIHKIIQFQSSETKWRTGGLLVLVWVIGFSTGNFTQPNISRIQQDPISLPDKLRWEFIKETKKTRTRPRKWSRKKSFFFLVFFFSWSLSWSKACFLVFFLLSCFLFYKFPPQLSI